MVENTEGRILAKSGENVVPTGQKLLISSKMIYVDFQVQKLDVKVSEKFMIHIAIKLKMLFFLGMQFF